MIALHSKRLLWVAIAALAFPIGCRSVGTNGVTPTFSPTPSATPSPTATPSGCATPDSQNPNVVYVGMTSALAVVDDPTYGLVGGYAVFDPSGSNQPVTASVLNQQTPGGPPITSQNTIQFFNFEPNGASIVHSAVGFTGSGFPKKPFAFPTPEASPTASAISNTAAWSTGLITVPQNTLCFSQEFTLKPGIYYFGDYSYYNLTTFQDVLVVATPTP